jgi:hypothetical protein
MTTTDFGALAEQVLNEATRELGLQTDALPQSVRDAAGDYRVAISDVVAAARQLEADTQELNAKRDLIPGPGWQRLRQEAVSEAQSRGVEADRRAAAALRRLEDSVAEAALPRIKDGRESLARDEFALALGNAAGNAAAERALRIAEHGSREAAAVLFSEFGQTVLTARGVDGRDLAETLRAARSIAAASATSRGSTRRELVAGAALTKIPKLAAARGAAGDHLLAAVQAAQR